MFDMVPLEHGTDALLGEFSRMINSGFWNGMDAFLSPRIDIVDKGDKYLLKADLPGFQKQEISISVEGGRLILSAEHREEVNEDEMNYLHRERRYGTFNHSLDIDGIDSSRICASYQSGVLEVDLPKAAEAKPQIKRIEIEQPA